jgi:serine protease inhibitor
MLQLSSNTLEKFHWLSLGTKMNTFLLKSVASQGSLGVKDIFEANTADLSEISRERLEVGDVLHSAQLEVNEEGSEAAAVTSIDIDIRLAASGNNGTDIYCLKMIY